MVSLLLEASMPKYLLQGKYSSEGIKGVQKDKASGRKAALDAAVTALGGKVECVYYCFGAYDVMTIVDLPDNVAVTKLCLTVASSGVLTPTTTPLLTLDEVDSALEGTSAYRGPGR